MSLMESPDTPDVRPIAHFASGDKARRVLCGWPLNVALTWFVSEGGGLPANARLGVRKRREELRKTGQSQAAEPGAAPFTVHWA